VISLEAGDARKPGTLDSSLANTTFQEGFQAEECRKGMVILIRGNDEFSQGLLSQLILVLAVIILLLTWIVLSVDLFLLFNHPGGVLFMNFMCDIKFLEFLHLEL
jgi:hypothetical protein